MYKYQDRLYKIDRDTGIWLQNAAKCLKDEQELLAMHDAIRDMEPEEAKMVLADFLQQEKDPEFYNRLAIKAQVDRHISRYFSKLGVNYAKLGR